MVTFADVSCGLGGDLFATGAPTHHSEADAPAKFVPSGPRASRTPPRGACSSCAISSDTLQGGVTRILTDRLKWVTEVVGGVDDSMDPEDSMSLGTGGYVPRYRQL